MKGDIERKGRGRPTRQEGAVLSKKSAKRKLAIQFMALTQRPLPCSTLL
jgi:hypothetical protein